MSPTLILDGHNPDMVIGSGGSNRIRSAIVQVILNYFCNNKSLGESIEAPRIHYETGSIFLEPGISLKNIALPDETILHEFYEKSLFFGGVNAVTRKEAFSDKRRGGATAIID